jgi:uncharacterized protein involved in outer membrane biogenesis
MIKRIFLIFFVFVLLLLGAIISFPFLFKDKIVAFITNEANKSLNANLSFHNDIDISLLRSFPDLSVGINELCITGMHEFEGDTLIYAPNFKTTLDIMSVLKGDEIDVKTVFLDKPYINIQVTKEGKASWDIMKPAAPTETADTSVSRFKVALKKFEINDGRFIYDDKMLGFVTDMVNFDHTLTGDFTQDNFSMDTHTMADKLSLGYGGIYYLNNVKTDAKVKMDMNLPEWKYTFKENEIKLNDLIIGFEGMIANPTADIAMDIKFKSKQTEFKNILSLVPAIYSKDFDKIQSSGKMSFEGDAKGVYSETSIPAFNVKLVVSDAMFKYPELPSPVKNVNFAMDVHNPNGKMDNTVVNLSRFHMELGNDPIDATLLLKTPISDPYIDAKVKGRLDLAQITKFYPLEKGTRLSGTLNSDVEAKGNMSAIEKQDFQNFNASGNMTATDISYVAADFPQELKVSSAALRFNPSTVTLSGLDAKIGGSDVKANGEFSNFFPYFLKDGILKGRLNLNSTYFNANQFMSDDPDAAVAKTAPQPSDTVELEAIELPANIDFTMNTNIAKLLYDNLVLDNMKGRIKLINSEMIMEDISFGMFNGMVGVKEAHFDTKNPKQPFTSFDLSLSNFDIARSVSYFNTIKALAPIAKYARGIVSARLKFSSRLDGKMRPVLSSLSSYGKLDIPSVTIAGFKPLTKMAETLKLEKYKNMSLQKIALSFGIKDGKVKVDPFDFNVDKAMFKVDGYSTLDQAINYVINISVPRSELGSINSNIEGLQSVLAKQGANIKLSEMLDIDVLLGGTITDPTVKASLKSLKNSFVDDAKEQLKEQGKIIVDSAKNVVIDRAKEERDRLQKEAEERIRREQERLKREQDSAKKALEEKGKEKIKDIFKKRP